MLVVCDVVVNESLVEEGGDAGGAGRRRTQRCQLFGLLGLMLVLRARERGGVSCNPKRPGVELPWRAC
jgi:hypothetical protein